MKENKSDIIKLTEFVKQAVDGRPADQAPVLEDAGLLKLCGVVNSMISKHTKSFEAWQGHLLSLTELRDQTVKLQEAVLFLREIEDTFYKEGEDKLYFKKVLEIINKVINTQYGMIGMFGEDEAFDDFVSVGMDLHQVNKIGAAPQGKGLLGVLYNASKVSRIDNIASHDETA